MLTKVHEYYLHIAIDRLSSATKNNSFFPHTVKVSSTVYLTPAPRGRSRATGYNPLPRRKHFGSPLSLILDNPDPFFSSRNNERPVFQRGSRERMLDYLSSSNLFPHFFV